MGFVGMAAIARLLEDLFYFGRRLEVGGDRRVVEREPDKLEGEGEEEKYADGAK
jgi:hypothetical protein